MRNKPHRCAKPPHATEGLHPACKACMVMTCGYSRRLQPNPKWKEQGGTCMWSHVIKGQPYSKRGSRYKCVHTNHDCPGAAPQVTACRNAVQLAKKAERHCVAVARRTEAILNRRAGRHAKLRDAYPEREFVSIYLPDLTGLQMIAYRELRDELMNKGASEQEIDTHLTMRRVRRQASRLQKRERTERIMHTKEVLAARKEERERLRKENKKVRAIIRRMRQRA